jgi:YggT family protein
MVSLVILIQNVIWLFIWIIIISAVLSWLIAFNVVNTNNRFVLTVADTLYRLTEPVLGPVRRLLPSMGGIDISPIIVILLLAFISNLLGELVLGTVAQP